MFKKKKKKKTSHSPTLSTWSQRGVRVLLKKCMQAPLDTSKDRQRQDQQASER
jgi:hypothetical protein